MTTIVRRAASPEALKVPVLLRFTDGKVVDPSRCPKGISAHGHWRFADVDDPDVNTICGCDAATDVPAGGTDTAPTPPAERQSDRGDIPALATPAGTLDLLAAEATP